MTYLTQAEHQIDCTHQAIFDGAFQAIKYYLNFTDDDLTVVEKVTTIVELRKILNIQGEQAEASLQKWVENNLGY